MIGIAQKRKKSPGYPYPKSGTMFSGVGWILPNLPLDPYPIQIQVCPPVCGGSIFPLKCDSSMPKYVSVEQAAREDGTWVPGMITTQQMVLSPAWERCQEQSLISMIGGDIPDQWKKKLEAIAKSQASPNGIPDSINVYAAAKSLWTAVGPRSGKMDWKMPPDMRAELEPTFRAYDQRAAVADAATKSAIAKFNNGRAAAAVKILRKAKGDVDMVRFDQDEWKTIKPGSTSSDPTPLTPTGQAIVNAYAPAGAAVDALGEASSDGFKKYLPYIGIGAAALILTLFFLKR